MSTTYDLVVRAARMITPDGQVSGTLGVSDGVITALESYDADLPGATTLELAEDEVLLPGLVDTHVHVNEPGRTEWEGFHSATRAAAAGGVTTLIDMPLNSIPPTCDVAALEVKRAAASGQCFVDVGFWGGAVPGNVGELRGLRDAGVFGFKCFLLPSGVDEFPHLAPDELEAALREVAALGATMIVHAEDSHTIDDAPPAHGTSYERFLASRPRGAENLAIARVIELARRTGCRVHILHLSSSDAIATIEAARADGVRLTVETCPHYLALSAEEIADGATQFKCCPPIRESDNRERLWDGLASGAIDFVVSDHSPCTPELKRLDTGDFGVAWGGISSVQLGLPVVWTEARGRGYALSDVVRWMAERPAQRAGLARKGRIAIGADADLVVLAPDESFVVDATQLFHKNAVTPYEGRSLTGRVRSTWLRGTDVDPANGDPGGRLLARGTGRSVPRVGG